MQGKILFVDDDPQLLEAIGRQFKKRFALQTAESGNQALHILQEDGPFAVVVSDMRMPGMDGIQLLARVKETWPDTVRLMLTGNADQETAVEAVNKGQIYRFLTKPCPTYILGPALALALRQYRLITAEKELLNKTLKGSVNVMAELLSLANSTAFSSGYRVKPLVKKLAALFQLPRLWQYEISALMSQLGCITVPADILHKLQAGVGLSREEQQIVAGYPETGARLIRQIPRLEQVADIIALQMQEYSSFPAGEHSEEVTLGAQILKAAIDYDRLLMQNIGHAEALQVMERREGVYNPDVLTRLFSLQQSGKQVEIHSVRFQELLPGMIAEEDVKARNGTLLIPKGQEITWATIQSLMNFEQHIGVVEPVRVRQVVHD